MCVLQRLILVKGNFQYAWNNILVEIQEMTVHKYQLINWGLIIFFNNSLCFLIALVI